MTCPRMIYGDPWSGHSCGRDAYEPEDDQPANSPGLCKRHYNVDHRIGKVYDKQRVKEAAEENGRARSEALIAALGCGRVDVDDYYGTLNGGVKLTAEEAAGLVLRLGVAGGGT